MKLTKYSKKNNEYYMINSKWLYELNNIIKYYEYLFIDFNFSIHFC